jgi:hypothetical protein
MSRDVNSEAALFARESIAVLGVNKHANVHI